MYCNGISSSSKSQSLPRSIKRAASMLELSRLISHKRIKDIRLYGFYCSVTSLSIGWLWKRELESLIKKRNLHGTFLHLLQPSATSKMTVILTHLK